MFGLIYSIASYLGFLGVFSYFAWFSDGLGVPKHVDSGAPAGLALALLVNASLVLLFGLQHSIMARAGFKRWLTRFVPAHLERATYVLASSLALVVLMWLWQPLTTPLWDAQGTALIALLWVVNVLGWLGVPFASFMIDHFDLFGVKQALHEFRRVSFERQGFVTPLLYKYVRHPMMSAILVGFWVTPHMTLGHLFLSAGMSVYIVIGVHFEEQSLARELGRAYSRYQASTPKFLPLGAAKQNPDDAPASAPSSGRAG
jgi:protein-S-isoprenylcysteine O-methyltransferase Ste14